MKKLLMYLLKPLMPKEVWKTVAAHDLKKVAVKILEQLGVPATIASYIVEISSKILKRAYRLYRPSLVPMIKSMAQSVIENMQASQKASVDAYQPVRVSIADCSSDTERRQLVLNTIMKGCNSASPIRRNQARMVM
jgi:hypothetical protein